MKGYIKERMDLNFEVILAQLKLFLHETYSKLIFASRNLGQQWGLPCPGQCMAIGKFFGLCVLRLMFNSEHKTTIPQNFLCTMYRNNA